MSRDTCERVISAEVCGQPATLAVRCVPSYPHSPNCTRLERCLGHPTCEVHATELRAGGFLERVRSYPRRVAPLPVSTPKDN